MSREPTMLKTAVVVFTVLTVATRAEVVAPTPAVGLYEAYSKNRYLSIDPTANGANLGKTFAIRVTLTDSLQFADAAGMTWWVGEPDESCLAGLVDDAQPRNWDGCPALHIGDCGIVPVSDYSVSSVDSDGDSPTSLAIGTIRRPGIKLWADCVGAFDGWHWRPPQGVTNIEEIVAVLKTFERPTALPDCGMLPCNATHTTVTDLHPQVPNRIVNINDAVQIILAFRGLPYPYGCPDDPCWDNLAAPCP